MAKTQIILTQSVLGLGAETDQLAVAPGYARNFLFPRGLAIPLTGANKRRLEVLRQRRAEREAHEFNTMSELAKSLSKMVLTVHAKVGEEGKLFGSITAGTIADELKHQFEVALDKKKIHLEQPLRALGEYDVELRLHPEVTTTLKVRVEGTTPEGTKVTAPTPEPKEKDAPKGKPEGRGRPEARGRSEGKSKEEAAGKADTGKERGERRPRPERKPKAPPTV
jgi:large subunit ribosomal protein L9